MIYFLLILALGDGIYIESYPDQVTCEIRRQVVEIEHGVKGKCLFMQTNERSQET